MQTAQIGQTTPVGTLADALAHPVVRSDRRPPAQPASPIERVDSKRALAKPPASHEIEEPVAPPKRLRNPTPVSGSKRGRKSFREMDSEVDLIEVPSEEKLNEKLYYSISEVASWFKVNTSLLRFWENEFDILQPRKTRKLNSLRVFIYSASGLQVRSPHHSTARPPYSN
jgi:hypothetical protein